jgi:hypothetical protein
MDMLIEADPSEVRKRLLRLEAEIKPAGDDTLYDSLEELMQYDPSLSVPVVLRILDYGRFTSTHAIVKPMVDFIVDAIERGVLPDPVATLQETDRILSRPGLSAIHAMFVDRVRASIPRKAMPALTRAMSEEYGVVPRSWEASSDQSAEKVQPQPPVPARRDAAAPPAEPAVWSVVMHMLLGGLIATAVFLPLLLRKRRSPKGSG